MRSLASVSRAFCSFLLILVLLSTHFLLAVLMDTEVYAAQLTSRKITLGSSQISATDVTYSVSFFAATTGTIKGIVVQFCNSASTAIIGTACTGPTGFDINKATLVVANQKINGTTVSNAYTIHANSDAHTLIITNATGNSANAGQSVTFDLGSTGGSDGITNSSTTGTFYARMLTYSNNTTASNYTDTSPGTHIDDGSVALSTANQLTTYARVQEQLQFCVGTTTVDDSTTTIANSCAGSFTGSCGTAVNLGVLDSTAVSISPVPVAPGTPGNGNNCNGAAMVLTNASNGVVITYFAEQDTSSGKLKVTGASCSGSSNTDQCFNDSASQSAFTAGTEAFGVTVGGTNCNGTTTTSYSCDMTSGTNVLIASSNYIGNTTTAFGTNNGFAWKDNGTTTQIASSSGPVENETLVLKFAGTPALTTPTGSYQVTTTYIATATF